MQILNSPVDARKMLPESRFLFTQLKNELHKHTQAASKQSLYYRKTNSSQGCGKEGEEPPFLLSYRGFYPLKMGGTSVGSRKMWFSPVGLAQLPISVLVQQGSQGWKCPESLMVSLPFSSHRLSHRGLGIHVHLGISTLPIANKACGDVTPWNP